MEQGLATDVIDEQTHEMRRRLINQAKDFKTSWVTLGQALYSVWNDKLFERWGFMKFEDFTSKELGITKSTAMRLLKTYYFVEEQEPTYLKDGFTHEKKPAAVPDMDVLNVLRLARAKSEVTRDDYATLRKSAFETGKDGSTLRKDLTAIIKERKHVDPEQEREERSRQSLKKTIAALRTFRRDMEALKLIPFEILEEIDRVIEKLAHELT